MAELNYQDVRRAVQEELRSLQSVINEIRSSHDDIRKHMQQSDFAGQQKQIMMYKINLFQQQLTTLTGLVYNMRSTSANNNLGPVLQQMNQMNLRLAALEETCREIISALGVKPASAIEEDEEYRPA